MSRMPPVSQSNRILWIDVVKGLTLFLVILHHAHQHLAWAGVTSYETSRLNNVLGLARMPLFFALSGYLSASILRRSWRELLTRRVMLFFHIFLIWTAVTLVVQHVILDTKRTGLPGPDEMLLLLGRSLYDPPGSLWFIWALTLYFLIARLTPALWRPIVGVISLLGSTFAFSQLHGLSYPQKATLSYAPFFLFAAFYGHQIYALLLRHPRLSLLLASGVTAAGLAFLALAGDTEGMGRGALRLLTGIGALILLAALLSQVAKLPVVRDAGLVLGQNSLKIYVIHSLLISLMVTGYVWLASGLPAFRFWAALPLGIVAAIASLWLARGFEAMGAGWLFALPKRLKPADERLAP